MRLETGIVKNGDDWRGLFIRGDNALMGFAPALRLKLDGRGDAMVDAKLRALLGLLEGCNETAEAKVQNVSVKFRED